MWVVFVFELNVKVKWFSVLKVVFTVVALVTSGWRSIGEWSVPQLRGLQSTKIRQAEGCLRLAVLEAGKSQVGVQGDSTFRGFSAGL